MSTDTPRPFDDPDITATQFLARVMHDNSLDLAVRMEAAEKLLQMGLGNYREQVLRITINGGLSRSPRLEDFSPGMQRDLRWIKRCFELGIEDPDIDNLEIAGHA
jgi:hypothetical protein